MWRTPLPVAILLQGPRSRRGALPEGHAVQQLRKWLLDLEPQPMQLSAYARVFLRPTRALVRRTHVPRQLAKWDDGPDCRQRAGARKVDQKEATRLQRRARTVRLLVEGALSDVCSVELPMHFFQVGECAANRWMLINCRKSCGMCVPGTLAHSPLP